MTNNKTIIDKVESYDEARALLLMIGRAAAERWPELVQTMRARDGGKIALVLADVVANNETVVANE